MRIMGLLDVPDNRIMADDIKTIIKEKENLFWEDLKREGTFTDEKLLSDLVDEMLNIGELYEPVIGCLGVLK